MKTLCIVYVLLTNQPTAFHFDSKVKATSFVKALLAANENVGVKLECGK